MPSYDAGLASGYVLRLNTNQDGQSVDGNYSVVGWYLHIIKGTGTGKWADGPHYWSVNINGSVYSGSIGSYNFQNYSVLGLGSGQTIVYHNADGTASIGVSGAFDDNNTWGELGDGSVGGGMGLSTIPRATTATFTNPMTMGTAYTINLPRASAGFTHTVEYYFGSASGTIGTGLGTSVNWTPPTTLAQQIPNNASGGGTIRVHTYSGGTYIGSRDSSVTIGVPASMVPTFAGISHSEGTPGLAANVGAYVQGLTKLNVTVVGAAGVEGSTISSYKVEVAGQVINAQTGTTPAPIATSGTVPVTTTVTDSRGRTKSQTVNITVKPYAPPAIVAITGVRALASGVPNDNGTYVRVNINAAVQSLVNTTERNALVYKIYSRLRGDTLWTLKDTTTPGGIVFNGFEAVGTYDIEQAFEFRVEIIDDFSTTATQFTVATAAIFMHWDGKDGVGIGKYRQFGQLDVLGQAYQNDGQMILDESLAFVPALLSANYRGPGPAMVYFNSAPTVAQGPYEWATTYRPNGSREVMLTRAGGSWKIVSQGSRSGFGGSQRLTPNTGWNTYNFTTAESAWADGPFITQLPSGLCLLSGLIRFPGGTPANGAVIASGIPESMRPDVNWALSINNGDTAKGITVNIDGTITARASYLSSTYVSLDGLAYWPAGVGTWTNVGTGGSSFGSGFADWTGTGGGGGHGQAAYWKDPYGFVWFRGMVKVTTASPAPNAVMVNLPSTHRADLVQHMRGMGMDGFADIGAEPASGIVWKVGDPGAVGNWISLAGLALVTAEARAGNPWTNIDYYANSWANYPGAGTTWSMPSYVRRGDGLCMMNGLIYGGSVGVGRAFALPKELWPTRGRLIIDSVAADARSRVDISGEGETESGRVAGGVSIVNGSNTWASLDNIKWAPVN